MVIFPPMIRISVESLTSNGAYLLDNGQEFYLWLGRDLAREFIQDVFRLDAVVPHLQTAQVCEPFVFFFFGYS